MRKSKVLSVALSSVLVATVAAATAMSVSAEITASSDIPNHKVGVTGGFNGWSEDVELTDADGDGVYEGVVEIAEVTEEMIKPWSVDDVDTGESYLQFKVRLDGEWTDSWGSYEPLHDRCWNSQSNVPVKEAVAGQPITFTVYFDIKNPSPAALENPDSYAEAGDDDYMYLNVYYKVKETESEPSKEEPSKEEPSKEEPSKESEAPTGNNDTTGASTDTASKVASETQTDTSSVPTGDATSAVALAAVVLASLGVAVVMTKKASAK